MIVESQTMVDTVAGGDYVARTGPLDGQVTVAYSLRTPIAKLHLDPDCPGLAATPVEARSTRTYRSALRAGLCSWSTACRMCCLEALLTTVLVPDPTLVTHPRRRRLAFMASAQPMVRRDLPAASGLAAGKISELTESGAERLRRIAANSGISLVETACGPVVHGVRGSEAVRAVARNLRTFVLPTPAGVDVAAAVETFWTLVHDRAPELDDMSEFAQMWETSRRLTS
jgi:hypothetical protein